MFTPPCPLESRRWKNKKVALFGGSFNPPHKGHLHVCEMAFRQLDLDFIWWMVTPQNPLKEDQPAATYAQRLKWSQDIVTHPKILVTDIEYQISTKNSLETVLKLQQYFPDTRFIWLTGTDNAILFHKWAGWRTLSKKIQFCFVARPPALDLVKNTPVKFLADSRHIWLLKAPLMDQSSTHLR